MPSPEITAILDTAARLGIPAPVYAPHVRPGMFQCWADRVAQVEQHAMAGRSTAAAVAECARYDGRPRDLCAVEARHTAEMRAWNLAGHGRRRIDAGHCELLIVRDGVELWCPLLEMTDAELGLGSAERRRAA